MRALLFVLAGALLAAVPGCLSSNHPFHTAKDVTFDESLVGEWAIDVAPPRVWSVAKIGKDAYELTESRDAKPMGDRYKAVLFTLNGKKYLNISPPDAAPERERNHHFVWKLETDGKSATVTRLSEKWLNEKAKRGELKIKHEATDDKVREIKATSEELREFLIKHGDEPFKDGDVGKLKKIK